jgi:drug/metabolite transporter (DMT)-like permease
MSTGPEGTQPADYRLADLEMGVIVFFWAMNWLVMKAGVHDAGGLSFAALRLIGATAIMVLISLVIRAPILPVAGERVRMAWIGFWQVAIMLTPSVVGLQFIGPGRAAVLVYTMQLWVLPLGWLVSRERVRPVAVAGSLIGFSGLMIYMNPALVNWHDHRLLLGNALVLSSGIGWAFGASLYRSRKWKSPAWTQTTWQILWSALAVAPVAWFFGEHNVRWTGTLAMSLAFNWVITTAVCYWLWARALTAMPASRAGQMVSLVPVLALLMSAAWTGERLSGTIFLSMTLIIAGIILSVRQPSLQRSAASQL